MLTYSRLATSHDTVQRANRPATVSRVLALARFASSGPSRDFSFHVWPAAMQTFVETKGGAPTAVALNVQRVENSARATRTWNNPNTARRAPFGEVHATCSDNELVVVLSAMIHWSCRSLAWSTVIFYSALLSINIL